MVYNKSVIFSNLKYLYLDSTFRNENNFSFNLYRNPTNWPDENPWVTTLKLLLLSRTRDTFYAR